MTIENTIQIISATNKTFCPLDPIDISKFDAPDSFIHFVTTMINKCFLEGVFPISEKKALIRPQPKKHNLDINDPNNIRPLSNLTYKSKLIERAILNQLSPHLETNKAISSFQSAYKKYFSTETALCRVHNDIVKNICEGNPSLLLLLDLSAAFDTIDIQILLKQLELFGVKHMALNTLKSYLSDRTQTVFINGVYSSPKILKYGIPQGSVLSPLLFSVYASSLANIISSQEKVKSEKRGCMLLSALKM